MNRPYQAPSLTRYGEIGTITGIFGGPSSGDVLRDANGNTVIAVAMSVDACAQQNSKCICTDNGTC